MARANGDKSKPARSSKRSAGPAATRRSVAGRPKGRPVGVAGARKTRTNDGYPAGKR